MWTWLYCNTCGWQTEAPEIAAAKCCGGNRRYVTFDNLSELIDYRSSKLSLKDYMKQLKG